MSEANTGAGAMAAMGAANDRALRVGFERLRAHLLNLAEDIFLEVLGRYPEDPTALRLLGVARCKMDRGEAGLAHLRAAAAGAPGSEAIWNDLAVAARDAGREDEAAHAHAKAVSLRDPAHGPLAPLARLTFVSDRAIHKFKVVDYDYASGIRHGAGRPAHPELTQILEGGRERFTGFIDELGELQGDFAEIELRGRYETLTPFWYNAWFPTLDGMALTGMLKRHNPARFVEVGSGVSTKFARRAVQRYGLRTRLTSIDPEPRNRVDSLCDQVLRKPLENCDVKMFEALEPGDIFFLDSSHRTFQGSDVTVFFTEILPRLAPGVIVQVHDIYLPHDYVSGHLPRLWNEQYLLATALLFGGDRFEVLFPCWWAGQDAALRTRARAALCKGPLQDADPYGVSFWMTKTA